MKKTPKNNDKRNPRFKIAIVQLLNFLKMGAAIYFFCRKC